MRILRERCAELCSILNPGHIRDRSFGSVSGEMLCTWARNYGVAGTGIDESQWFTEQAKRRALELGVAGQVTFIHDSL
jgi:cyclopropane fatty-acyl-phospholipid synthase-like methyltransferase